MTLLYSGFGSGNSNLYLASFAFCRLEIYEDKLTFKVTPFGTRTEVLLEKVRHVKHLGGIPFVYEGVYIKYESENGTQTIAFFPYSSLSKNIISILNEHCRNLEQTIQVE